VDVDEYGRKLKDMNCAIALSRGRTDRVNFKSLVDILELEKSNSEAELSSLGDQLHIANINHHIATQVTQMAELSRRILMAGCQPDRSAIRAKIESQDASLLALYRGFSRFMLEDLEMHPETQSMSRSKQRKLSVKVSFEMIMVRKPTPSQATLF
jgi:pyoverdine/dityrosine biosynthesis protein Dit1